MQNAFEHQKSFVQYQPQSHRTAPTALMVDPILQYHQASTPGSGGFHDSSIPPVSQAKPSSQQSSADLQRSLPSPNIDQASIDDSYVQFIFYCNPSIPSTTDTSELRKGFRSMPKTDGNSFDTFTLFGLIKKLEAKEIETWAQVVIELGVELPDITQNQSSQKVQQFAVRLKRWLHAFHIDAFFQYCFGRPTSYSTDIPPAEESISEKARDGVPPEEDLALRALLPEYRPKRGRRKKDSIEGELATKRARREDSFMSEDLEMPSAPVSVFPQSAFPWAQQPSRDDPWAAAQKALMPRSNAMNTQQQLLQGHSGFWVDNPDTTPSTPYPQSAVTFRHPHNSFLAQDTPQSAHPSMASSPSRSRRRHGPAVSAAWPSGGNAANGKLPRGRPPNNRSVQDGPFSTFPANPQSKPLTPRSVDTPSQTPSQTPVHTPVNSPHPGLPASGMPLSVHIPTIRKPSKLSLQVPQHSGGPVRLATPPPKVLVNGEAGVSAPTSSHTHERRNSADFFNTIDDEANEGWDGSDDGEEGVDWKRRALLFRRKLKEKEAELKAVRRRVLEAVM